MEALLEGQYHAYSDSFRRHPRPNRVWRTSSSFPTRVQSNVLSRSEDAIPGTFPCDPETLRLSSKSPNIGIWHKTLLVPLQRLTIRSESDLCVNSTAKSRCCCLCSDPRDWQLEEACRLDIVTENRVSSFPLFLFVRVLLPGICIERQSGRNLRQRGGF